MFILKIKGTNPPKYVGRKRTRSWDWTPQTDISKARIFISEAGVKKFFGKVTKLNPETGKYDLIVPYTEHYEIIPVGLLEPK